MKIALIGYGKMGKAIEKVAEERGHEIVARLSRMPEKKDLENADVAIEFTRPEHAFDNITFCIENDVPVVSGTTGWLSQKPEIEQMVEDKNGAFIYASNFSLGVNLFLELTKKMALLMQPYDNYIVEMEEIHHTQKLDAPSGTAITIADTIIANSDYTAWDLNQKNGPKDIPIFAKRIDEVPGTHSIKYQSNEDEIELKHTAHSRDGFALGAVMAAEYIKDKKGIFTMKDVLGIQ